jgi:DNA-binding winged helix-turn-helix (wHTH) protein
MRQLVRTEIVMPRARPGTLHVQLDNHPRTARSIEQDITTIGRSESCDIVIPQSSVSRLHARIELQHDRYVLFDAGSANGTFVNGARLEQSHQLSTNDTIWLGSPDVSLSFSDPDETAGVVFASGAPALSIDEEARIVQVYGLPVQLTTLEYELLDYLAGQARRVCTREECFLAVWRQPYDHLTCEHALNACIARLRRNLRAAAQQVGQPTPEITTIKRIGFRLDSAVSFTAPAQRPAPLQARSVGKSTTDE